MMSCIICGGNFVPFIAGGFNFDKFESIGLREPEGKIISRFRDIIVSLFKRPSANVV
jgi:hypothetical protein